MTDNVQTNSNPVKTVIIDDVTISVTVKYYINLLGQRNIIECTDNLTGRRVNLMPYKGSIPRLGAYVTESLDRHIAAIARERICPTP